MRNKANAPDPALKAKIHERLGGLVLHPLTVLYAISGSFMISTIRGPKF